MSYSMLGGTGMGAAGTGMGAGPAMRQALSPQVLAMLQMMQAPQGGAAPGAMGQAPMPPAPGPMQAPPTGTPMAGYIGAPGGAGMMQRPPMQMPAGQPPGMQATPAAAQPGANPMGGVGQQMQQYAQMQNMLNQLKGGQTGVPGANGTSVGQMNPSGVPLAQQMPPNWLQSMLGMGGTGAAPGGPGA